MNMDDLEKDLAVERAQRDIEPENSPYRHVDMTGELCSVAELRYRAIAVEVQRGALWLN
jgi:hypothetical protein